ncbi:MAG: N-acetylmuramoyl-L-alanine amidase family protein [Butyricicoccus sp.]
MAAKGRRRRGKKQSKGAMVWLFLMAALSVFLAYCVYQAVYVQGIYEQDAKGSEPSDCPSQIESIPVTTDFVPIGYAARTGKQRSIHYITIHETDNTEKTATAEAHNEYIHTYGRTHKLSWHYTVDENEIYHHIPDNETAFHAGDNIRKEGGNRNGIGIELCVNEGSDFSTTLHNAAALVAYLMDKYDLDMDALKKHQDFSGKTCPKTLITEGCWDEFCTMVEQALYDRQTALSTDSEN